MPAPQTRQSAAEQLRGVDRKNRSVDIVASTFDLDSYDTRVDPNGWDLEQFKKNPVICLQHDASGYSGSNGLPVANAIPETVRVENNKLVMRIQFPAEGKFPLADQVFNLVADGFLRGVSVGFDPDMTAVEDTQELVEGENQVVRIYRKQTLVEVSLVTIPSNDNALVQRAEKLNADQTTVRQMTEVLEEEIKKQPPTERTVNVETPEAFQALTTEMERLKAGHEARTAEFEKYKAYFDNKQPANKASTKVLKKFFEKVLKEDIPTEEIRAWERMGEAVEALDEKPAEPRPEPTSEDVKVEEKPEVKVEADIQEEPQEKPNEEVPAAPPQETKEETPPPSEAPVQEAPAPERKASVQISLTALPALSRSITDACVEAFVKASREGVPLGDKDAIIEATGTQFLKAFTRP